MSLFTFDRDPTYDVESIPQTKDWSSYMYDSYVWDGYGDMITYFFHPFEDDLMQHFHNDFQPPSSDFDRH